MSEEKPKSVPSRRRFRKVWIPAILGILLLLWFLHPVYLSWALTRGLETWSSANHLTFSAEKIAVRLDGPVSLRGLKFRSTPGSGLATALDIPLLEWRWTGLSSLFSDSERFIRDLQIKGLSGIWDLSTGEPGGEIPLSLPILRCLPREIAVEVSSLELLGKSEKWQIRDLALKLSENEAGTMDAASFALHLDGYSKSLGPLHARTAWKNGTLWLADMELAPGITAENLSVDFLHAGGPAISLSAACFGGSLRSDLTVQSSGGVVDMASWASNIPLDRMASLVGIPGEIGGKLVEGRFTFRGLPDRPADAEASLRLVANGFQYNKRGWELLEVGASLIHRRLVVTNFDLRQKENRVNFNGEISLAEGWSQISKSPFLVNFHADIRELGTLAGLLGGPLNEAAGRMTAAGSVSGHPGELDGFLSLEASGMEFRSLPPSSLRLEAVFRKNEIDVAVCDLFSRKDTASLRGTVGIPAPHQYAAEVDARIADLAVYLTPFHAPGAEKIYAGALDVRWQGDGNWKSHSGAFDLKLRDFVSGPTPAGLTGKFAGTYSPQNIYFSKLEAEHGPLRLGTQATFASSGITLKDVELKTANTSLLEGAAFIPLDIFAVFAGKDWRGAVDPDREAYLRLVTPKELNLRSLLDLAGQQAPLEGQLRLNVEAGGPPSSLTAKGDLSVRDLLWKLPGSPVPPSLVTMKFSAAGGEASFNGLLETKKFPPVTLSARTPFGLVRTGSGDWQWANPSGTFEAALDFPKTELAVFRSFLPKLRRLNGSVSGRLAFSGTIGEPRTDGRIELKDGEFEISTRTPAVTKTEALLAFDGTRMRIEHFRGELGAGTFQISGGVGLSQPTNPAWDLQLRGEKILLMRDAGMRLRANVEATLKGDNSAGAMQGTIRFVDGRIYQRLEITPLLLVAPEEATDATFLPPFEPGSVPAPFANWTLNLKIENETPFLIQGNIASGEIIPNVSLRGTLGQPVPVGRITLKDVQAFLPFTTMNIQEGRVDFLPDSPWIPLLDVRGTAKTPDFEIQAYAFGPLNEKKLILRSEPPLPQEALILLLTTGIATDGQAGGARLGEAAAGQGGLFLLRSFAKQLDLPGVDTDALLNRLQIQAVPPRSLGEQTTMRGRLRLFDNMDLVTERDGYGFFNAGASYTWRFR
ncbi:MAG: translocation/assembly module TamB domain-containing protein [Terrimicrobiaceae bacterium]